MHNGLPLGNLSIAQGILFAGNSQVKAITSCLHSNIMTISLRTYHLMQRCYLVPAICNVWERFQVDNFSAIKDAGAGLELGGDARFDSRGYSAKYGSYSCSNLSTGKLIDIQLVQVLQFGLNIWYITNFLLHYSLKLKLNKMIEHFFD